MTPAPFQPPASYARRCIAIALAVLVLAPPVLVRWVLRPIERDRQRYAAEENRLRAHLARFAEQYPDVPPDVLLERERATLERMHAERERIHSRARTLPEGITLSDVLASGVEGRIDFKVTLFEARDRLGRIAEEKGVFLPADLGIAETIASAEQAQMRLWQLASTVLLLERFIETGIREIMHVEALDPIEIPAASEALSGVTVYPVSLHFKSSYARFNTLLRALGDERGFFAVRSFWMRLPGPESQDQLDCRIVALARRVTPAAKEAVESEIEEEWILDLYRESALETTEEDPL